MALNFLTNLGDKNIHDPKSFEDQSLKMVGRELYDFFVGIQKNNEEFNLQIYHHPY